MNIPEGARRMRLAGQWVFLIAVTALILWYALAKIINSAVPGFVTLANIALIGIALWVAAWIIDGFGQNTH